MGRFVRTVGVVLSWQVAASVCYYAVFAATPFFRETFGLSRFLVGLVITALTLGYTALLLPTGALIDGLGERRVLVVGLFGMGLVTGTVVLAPSYPVLLAVVFCLGVLYATAIPGTNRAIFESIPEGRQHLALGIKQVGVTAGSGISAVLITSIAGTHWGWEAGFLLAGVLAICVAALFSRVYAGNGRHRQRRTARSAGAVRPGRVPPTHRRGLLPRGRPVHDDRLHDPLRRRGRRDERRLRGDRPRGRPGRGQRWPRRLRGDWRLPPRTRGSGDDASSARSGGL